MGAADDIRAGKLAKFQALEEAGINPFAVQIRILVEETESKHFAGKHGIRRFHVLNLKPNPEVIFRRESAATEHGFEDKSHVTLKGPFPPSLAGDEIVMEPDGTISASVPTSRQYATPKAFRADIEAADSFLIDGERYAFRSGGFMDTDKTASQWSIKLVRAPRG